MGRSAPNDRPRRLTGLFNTGARSSTRLPILISRYTPSCLQKIRIAGPEARFRSPADLASIPANIQGESVSRPYCRPPVLCLLDIARSMCGPRLPSGPHRSPIGSRGRCHEARLRLKPSQEAIAVRGVSSAHAPVNTDFACRGCTAREKDRSHERVMWDDTDARRNSVLSPSDAT